MKKQKNFKKCLKKKYWKSLIQLIMKEDKKEKVREYKIDHGTTFCGAIVGKDKTLLANVGDSRAYIFKDGKLTQVTKDDSKVQVLYDEGKISSKEEMRFNRDSNQINKVLGFPGYDEPTFTVLDNQEYDSLMIVSDGVSDYLSEDDNFILLTEANYKNYIDG